MDSSACAQAKCVSSAVDRLTTTTKRAYELADRLDEALRPVLSPAQPQADAGGEADPAPSPLFGDLTAINADFSNALDRIEEIITRLNLN